MLVVARARLGAGPGCACHMDGPCEGWYIAHRVWHRVLHPLRRAVLIWVSHEDDDKICCVNRTGESHTGIV